jgi:hypothetical protein
VAELTSTATFTIADASAAVAETTVQVLPAAPFPSGSGRLVHPTLGAYDYEVKPDEWVNIDGGLVVPPVWASTKTMGGAVNALWPGYLRDVLTEERWKSLGGLSMPIGQLRMLIMIWSTPVDPATGYVEWYPNYISPLGFKVIPINLGAAGIVFDDVVNSKDEWGDPNGWVTQAVTLQLKLVEQLEPA